MPNPEQPQPIQENLADVKEPQQNNVEGLEVAHGEELENVVDAANALAEKIERDEKVTEGEVYDLREALGQMEFNYGGDSMSITEIQKIKDWKKNLEILKEINAGSFKHIRELTFLTVSAADAIRKKRDVDFLIGDSTIPFDSLASLSDRAAELLSHCKLSNLRFDKITSLSDQAIEHLSNFFGELYLKGLTSLSDNAAASLSKSECLVLALDGLTSLSDKAAESLAEYKGQLAIKKEFRLKINQFKTKK
ncbi:MAG: hypothetical protein WC663_02395 [Patescibacteria group bacterium]|jgi:hypothetical protein